MYTKSLCVVAQFLALSVGGAVKFEQSGTVIDCYDFVEVSISVPKPPAGNPFLDADISGEFAHQGETANVRVDGFCDSEDGSLFRIRFMPATPGKYTYTVIYKRGGDGWHHTGSFTARGGKQKGIVRVDQEHPTHFVYEGTGEHFFYNSTTAYWLLGWKDD